MKQDVSITFIEKILSNKNGIKLIKAQDADYMNTTLFEKFGKSHKSENVGLKKINGNAD